MGAEELLAAFKELRVEVEAATFDSEGLQRALTRVQGKEVWSAALVAQGELVLRAAQAFDLLRAAASPLDAAAKEEASRAVDAVKEYIAQYPDMARPSDAEELMEKGAEL